jgi:hypothetical protein
LEVTSIIVYLTAVDWDWFDAEFGESVEECACAGYDEGVVKSVVKVFDHGSRAQHVAAPADDIEYGSHTCAGVEAPDGIDFEYGPALKCLGEIRDFLFGERQGMNVVCGPEFGTEPAAECPVTLLAQLEQKLDSVGGTRFEIVVEEWIFRPHP